MVAERVSLDQRFRRAGDCPICEGGDGMKRGRGARCYGFEMARRNAVVCTQIASPHPSGNGYVHVVDKPCDCGDDHSAGYRGDFIPRASKPATPAKITQAHKSRTPDAIHDYGAARLLRYGSGKEKRLCWQHFDRDRGWIDGLGGVTPGFYRAEAVRNADTRKPVYLAEGEKAVDALAAAGAVAGCNPGGAGKWRAEYGAILSGRHVVILADADETGRAHADAIADALADVAASVRQIELEGAHDVADWLADGHTYGDLLEITACTLPAQNPCPASASSAGGAGAPEAVSNAQDSAQGGAQGGACPNCQRWQDRAKIAETTVATLRREKAMTSRILGLPKDQLSAPLKPAAIAVREVLSQPRARDEQGMEMVYRRAISQRCGVSDDTAGEYLRKLADAGVIHREVRKSFDSSEIYISEGPLFDTPEQIAPTPTTWGGRRTKKGCPHCQSIEIVPTAYACTNCGAHLRADELIDVVILDTPAEQESSPASASSSGGVEGAPAEGTHDAGQDTLPPLDTILRHLAPDAQDDTGDALRCPECGRGGDMLKDYGDGPRCRACDALAERRVS